MYLEDFVVIYNKKKKNDLEGCLNDLDINSLKEICYYYGNDGINSKKACVNYLKDAIPEMFSRYLDQYAISYEAYEIIKNNIHNQYCNSLLSFSFMFSYYNKKEEYYVVPEELINIFKKKFTKEKEKQFRKHTISLFVIGYLIENCFMKKDVLKKYVLEEKHLHITEEEFYETIKNYPQIIEYKDYYTVSTFKDVVKDVFKNKPNLDNKKLNIYDIQDAEYIRDLILRKILALLSIDEIEESQYINNKLLPYFLTSYTDLLNLPDFIYRKYHCSLETKDKIQDIIDDYDDELRFWEYNGRTFEEYNQDIFLQTGFLKERPKKTDLLSCLSLMSKDGLNLIKEEYNLKTNNIKKIQKEILNSLNDSFTKSDISILLDSFEDFEDLDYSLYYGGYIYLLKENNKIEYIIPDEIKEIIASDDNDNYDDLFVNEDMIYQLLSRYIELNGVIRISKLKELLEEHHDIYLNKKEIIDKLEEMSIRIVNKEYATFIPDITLNDIKSLMKAKDSFKEYRIVSLDEINYEMLLLEELNNVLKDKKLNDDNRAMLFTNALFEVSFGNYDSEAFSEYLSSNGLAKYFEAIDNVIIKYQKKIGIWTFNGFTLDNELNKDK